LLVAPDQNFTAIGFGSSAAISRDERWMYISAPGNNTVYAYERIDVEAQSIVYTTDGVTSKFEYTSALQVNFADVNQITVTIGNRIACM
jgi:hypothetical protein